MKYPKIIAKVEHEDKHKHITLCLLIPAEIIFFEGHFPNMPILPGMVQVDWAIFFASKFFDVTPEMFSHIEKLKFTAIIKPNQKLFLNLMLENNILTFKYFNDNVIYSTGKIKS